MRLGSKAHSCRSCGNLLRILNFSVSGSTGNRAESKFQTSNPILWTCRDVVREPRFSVSELERQTADDALRRADDEQLVVYGLIRRGVVEEVADADQHLPFRGAE